MGTSTKLDRHSVARRSAAAICIALVAVVLLAGCGGSSKPAYCSARTNLETSIKGLTGLNVSGGISGLQAQFKKIQTDATALVSQAKGDFPSQTSAIKSSLSALESSVGSLTGSPSAGQIATIASNASAFANAVKSFVSATSSKCG